MERIELSLCHVDGVRGDQSTEGEERAADFQERSKDEKICS